MEELANTAIALTSINYSSAERDQFGVVLCPEIRRRRRRHQFGRPRRDARNAATNQKHTHPPAPL